MLGKSWWLVFISLMAILLVTFVYTRLNNISLRMLFLSLKMDASVYVSNDRQLPYRLYIPTKQDKNNKLPLILVLQSAYGRGDDNYGQLSSTISKFVSNHFQDIQNAYILAPQCPEKMEWNNNPPSSPPFENYDMAELKQSWRQELTIELIDKLIREYNVDPERIYITGISMGASGTWEMLYRFPQLFAAAIILNGRTDPNQASAIAKTPIRHFHGKKDEIAPVNNSIHMAESLKVLDADSKLILFNAGHNIVDQTYKIKLYKWMISKRKQ